MSQTGIATLKIENFTAFRKLDLTFSSGINVVIGANSTGKSHLLKLLYSACDITLTRKTLPEKMVDVFLPALREKVRGERTDLGRLVHHGSPCAEVRITRNHDEIFVEIQSPDESPHASVVGEDTWYDVPMECAYIPAEEVLANAPGFLPPVDWRTIYFEGVYADVVRRAYLPALKKEQLGASYEELLETLKSCIEGEIVLKGDEFFRRQGDWHLEFALLAEGYRKLGLLWLLIRNGSIGKNSVLFWDVPEANLNPKLMGEVIEILLELQRRRVQIFLATHDYVVLKEFDLRRRETDRVRFFSLYRDETTKDLECQATDDFDAVDPNLILDTMVDLYDRDVKRALGTGGLP